MENILNILNNFIHQRVIEKKTNKKQYTMRLGKDFTVLYVAQNKPDYLLLLSKFCISTTKHLSMIMYV